MSLRPLVVLAAFVLALGSVSASRAEPAPKVFCPKTEHDFGRVDRLMGAAQHVFEIKNEGDAPLEIRVAGTSCKCTVAAPNDNRIAPGETTQVTLEVTFLDKVVAFAHNARLTTNDPGHPEIELRVKGTILQPAALFPESLPFAEMRRGQTAYGVVVVASEVWNDIKIRDLKCTLAGAKLATRSATPKERADAGESFKSAVAIEIAIPVDLNFKEVSGGAVSFLVAPGPDESGEPVERTVPIAVSVGSRLTIAGDLVLGKHVHFEIVPSAKGKRMNFAVTLRDEDKRLAIKKVDTNVKCLKVALEPTPASERTGVYRLVLDIPKGSKPESHMGLNGDEPGYVSIEFDHPRIKPVRFSVLVAVIDEE